MSNRNSCLETRVAESVPKPEPAQGKLDRKLSTRVIARVGSLSRGLRKLLPKSLYRKSQTTMAVKPIASTFSESLDRLFQEYGEQALTRPEKEQDSEEQSEADVAEKCSPICEPEPVELGRAIRLTASLGALNFHSQGPITRSRSVATLGEDGRGHCWPSGRVETLLTPYENDLPSGRTQMSRETSLAGYETGYVNTMTSDGTPTAENIFEGRKLSRVSLIEAHAVFGVPVEIA